jgi:hypothetical protein
MTLFWDFWLKKKEKKKRVQSNRRFEKTAGSPVFPVLSGFHRSNYMADPTFEPDRSSLRFTVWPVRPAGPVFKTLVGGTKTIVHRRLAAETKLILGKYKYEMHMCLGVKKTYDCVWGEKGFLFLIN